MLNQTMDNTQIPIHKMEVAARNVDKAILTDSNAPRLIDLMNINPQTGSTVSGLTDQDYPTLTGMSHVLNSMTQISCVNTIPLPAEVATHCNHIQCHSMMGLFVEIGRAWLTIDSDIYVWTYEDNTDLAYFDGINETIITVGLVKPKPGVFQPVIKYLLVVTTAIDIFVLGVMFNEMQEMQLTPEPLFNIPTDGVTTSSIAGTSDGRLFLGTEEGSLLEISYQAESGWFGKRCKKVNLSTSALSFLVPSFINAALSERDKICQISIDNSRHVMYTLTEKGTVEVYYLGEKGNSFFRVTKISQASLVNQAMNTVKTLDSQNFKSIISISAVEAYESANVHLVIVAETGVRFYMSVFGLSHVQAPVQPTQTPYTLTLLHVRLPPGYSANVTVRPRAVHMSHYRDRNLILLSTVNEKDVLWCMSSDLFPFAQTLMEAYNTVHLDGHATAIAEVRHDGYLDNSMIQEAPPMVVRQHVEPPHKYVVLTSRSVHIFMKLRPVDLLKKILKESYGMDTESLKAFFAIQKEDQACATSLILASLESEDNVEVAEYATRAFFMFGGEPKLSPINATNIFSGPSVFSPSIISTPAPPHFQLAQNLSQTMSFDYGSSFVFSPKHNGLYLYLGRILRPIWNKRCVDLMSIDEKTRINVSTIRSEDCVVILNNLKALHNFLTFNTQLSNITSVSSSHGALYNATRASQTIQDVQLEERQSLDAFKLFVCHCCQIVGLWKILCEHQFHLLIAALAENQQQVLQNTTFKELFLYRQDVCSLLITALVNSYLGDNASVDFISAKLREVCPHLYKTEDATFSKAYEKLKSARTVQNNDEKEEMVFAALNLCKSIAPNFNLSEVCREFTYMRAYDAVIELCHHCGKKVDPDKIAENFYNSDNNAADQEGFNYFKKRMDVYKQVLNMLETLYMDQLQTQVDITQDQTVTSQTILLNGLDQFHVGPILGDVINEILNCPDEILHIALYEWMVSKNMTGDLIRIGRSSLETYLKRTSTQHPDNIPVMDLLWKYYECNNNHAAASKVLNNLASRSGPSVSLRDRLSYLARAIMCMRSDKVGYAPYLGMFLRDLEDKMEVAKVQEQILDAIVNLQAQIPNAQEIIATLNSELFEISQLYENFAEPFKLLECQLAIIDCAGYTDSVLIESIWQQILSEEIRKCSGSGNDKVAQVLTKVKQLARKHAHSPHCFPLDYIVYELEIVCAKLKADEHLVPTTLASMGISLDKLILVYNNLIMISVNDHFWQMEENEFHLTEATAALINCFIDSHDSYNSVEKRKITSLCQDTVAALLSNLYSKPNTDHLVNHLRSIQAKLSRI